MSVDTLFAALLPEELSFHGRVEAYWWGEVEKHTLMLPMLYLLCVEAPAGLQTVLTALASQRECHSLCGPHTSDPTHQH